MPFVPGISSQAFLQTHLSFCKRGKCVWVEQVTINALTFGGKLRRSPFGRVSSLLSSSTEFRFSTHSGSTSPSKMIHWRFCSSPRTLSMILKLKENYLICVFLQTVVCGWDSDGVVAHFLRMCVNKPSVHSRVFGSRVPYRWSLLMALGSMMWATPSTPSSRSRALRRTRHAMVFPLPEGPTIIRPWLIWVIWYSWSTWRTVKGAPG